MNEVLSSLPYAKNNVSPFPRNVEVAKVISSRYDLFPNGGRPLNWDRRMEGVDQIETTLGEIILLSSNGQQSCPKVGWKLMLLGGNEVNGYTWTLLGISKGLNN